MKEAWPAVAPASRAAKASLVIHHATFATVIIGFG